MTALSQELTKNYPLAAGISVADFRAALVAMGREMHDDTQAEHQSLWTWWQWLDDEGYERQAFAKVLCQVGRTTIGDEAFAELAAYSKSIENDPDGISTLIEYTNKHYPELAEEIAKIEKMAEEEDNQIQNMAGGMRKGAKDALIGIGTVAGVGLVGLGVKGIHSYWKRTKVERQAKLLAEKTQKELVDKSQKEINEKLQEEKRVAESRERSRLATEESFALQKSATKDITTALKKAGVYSEKDKFFVAAVQRKFIPSEYRIEEYLAYNAKELIDPDKLQNLLENTIGDAVRATIRKDQDWLEVKKDKDLTFFKRELEKEMSDEEVGEIVDFNRMIIDILGIGKEHLTSLRDESTFAKVFYDRHPSILIGLKERAREEIVGIKERARKKVMGDRNLSEPRKMLENILENGTVKNYINRAAGAKVDLERLDKSRNLSPAARNKLINIEKQIEEQSESLIKKGIESKETAIEDLLIKKLDLTEDEQIAKAKAETEADDIKKQVELIMEKHAEIDAEQLIIQENFDDDLRKKGQEEKEVFVDYMKHDQKEVFIDGENLIEDSL